MSRVLHYDCQAGISGDMNLAALIDLGVPEAYLKEQLKRVGLDEGYHLVVGQSSKAGLAGTRVDVHIHEYEHGHHVHGGGEAAEHHHGHRHEHVHRTWRDIREMILGSRLESSVQETALAIFERLAVAEGLVHGKSPEEVHFHEVGATDSIVDIVGAAICLDYLKADRITSTPVELGAGMVKCAHGVLPVPAPATVQVMKGAPVSLGGTDHEATTPTGAAFIVTVADEFSPRLRGRCVGTGLGIGHRDSERLPNVLRVSLWETEEEGEDVTTEQVVRFSARMDDMTAEHLAFLSERLFEAGAVDVWQEPVYMKKGRLGTGMYALVHPDRASAVLAAFFRHSTTLGICREEVARHVLLRQESLRVSPWGEVRVKTVSGQEGMFLRDKVEYDDLSRIARENHLTLKETEDICRHGKCDERH